jgi:hypothetical protein
VATGVRGVDSLSVRDYQDINPKEGGNLERGQPTFEFFETLESDSGYELVQIREKAHKRRSHRDVGLRLEGRNPRRG